MSKPAKSKSKTNEVEPAAHDLSAIPAAALSAELRRRQRRVESLQDRYKPLIACATKLREGIEALGGSPGRSRWRARRWMRAPSTASPAN